MAVLIGTYVLNLKPSAHQDELNKFSRFELRNKQKTGRYPIALEKRIKKKV